MLAQHKNETIKRIFIVGKYYYPFRGGIEENCRSVAEYLAKQYTVTVLAYNHNSGSFSEKMNNVSVIRRHVDFIFKSQPFSLQLFKGIKFQNYDLVHIHSPNIFATFAFFFSRLFSKKVPLVVTHHMDIHGRKILRAISIPFVHWLIREAQVTIVTSSKNFTISKDLPKNGNYEVVPLGISPENYQVTEELRNMAREWKRSLAGDAPVIGFIGRHARYKGLSVLLKALILIPNAHAFIAGDGPYRCEIEAEAKQLGLDHRVHFLGSIDHEKKLMLLTSIDVFAFPSTEVTEAFGISQMEAMLCGAPVVASDLPTGVTDVSINEKTALLAPPFDHVSFAAQLVRIISDPELRDRLARTAKDHIMNNMTDEVVSLKTKAIFERVIEETVLRKKSEIK